MSNCIKCLGYIRVQTMTEHKRVVIDQGTWCELEALSWQHGWCLLELRSLLIKEQQC